MRFLALTVALAATGLLLVAQAPAVAGAAACQGQALSGHFRAIPGSAGAGNISYELTLRNRSTTACFVTGIPALTLLSPKRLPLPTHALFAGPRGALTAVLVNLAPGRSASLSARFSPDVPGPGEPQLKTPCEPIASLLRVVVSGGGALVVPITPPTPVCEHGMLQITSFRAA